MTRIVLPPAAPHVLVRCRSPRSGRPLTVVLPAGHPAHVAGDDTPPRWGAAPVALTAAALVCAALAAGTAVALLNGAAATVAAATATLLLGALWVRVAVRAAGRHTGAAPVRGPAPAVRRAPAARPGWLRDPLSGRLATPRLGLVRPGPAAGSAVLRLPAPRAAPTGVAAAALLAVTACASAAPPRVTSTVFLNGTLAPRPADAPVRLYQATRPACAFDEVGAVKVKGADFRQADKFAEAMRTRVRQMGGDAIINFGKQEVVTGQTGVTHGAGAMGGAWMGGPWVGGWPGAVMQDVRNDKALVLTGTVVRFRDPACAASTDRPAAGASAGSAS